jgi:putative ABC transport system permease protein
VLPLLGVRPVVGRAFDAGTRDGTLTIISYGLWQSQFGADPDLLGRKVQLDGAPYTILGVMRDVSTSAQDVEMWTLLALREEDFADRGNNTSRRSAGSRVSFEQAGRTRSWRASL